MLYSLYWYNNIENSFVSATGVKIAYFLLNNKQKVGRICISVWVACVRSSVGISVVAKIKVMGSDGICKYLPM